MGSALTPVLANIVMGFHESTLNEYNLNKPKFYLRGCLHEISFRAKLNIFISVSGQFLVTVSMIQPEMKLVAGVISVQSF